MTATTIRVQMAQRKDTAAGWTAANPILLLGEIGYETDTKKFKIGDGTTNWNSLAYLPIPDGSGNLTITGNLEIGSTGTLTFEGSTADGFETTLAVTDPTADRTITLPDVTGTVVTTGDTGSVTGTMIADGTIVNADINVGAEIAVSKLANGTADQVLVTDGTDVSWSDNLTLAGDLTVNGTTTTINTQDLLVEDKNIIIGNVDTPTDLTADGGGITLKGSTDKTINWVDATDAWTLSENVNIASGKEYRIDGTKVLDATSLGGAVVSSSLTSVGTIGTGTWQGSAIDAAYLDSTIVTTGDTGTVTSTMILDGTIVDADINASAAIAGTKISPDFGSQNVITTGTATAAALIPSGSSVPTNGVYLPSSNNVAISSNAVQRVNFGTSEVVFNDGGENYDFRIEGDTEPNLVFVDASTNRVGLGDSTPDARLTVKSSGASSTPFNVKNSGGTEIFRVYQTAGGGSQTSFKDASGNTNIFIDGGTGQVGIGTSSPQNDLHVNNASSDAYVRVTNNSGTRAYLGSEGTKAVIYGQTSAGAATPISFNVGSSEAARIDSSGRLLVGTSSAGSFNAGGTARTPRVQFYGDTTDNGSVSITRTQTLPVLFMNAGASGTNVINGDGLGRIIFTGYHTSAYYEGAYITAEVDGTPGAGDLPTRLVFSTTSDGASSPTERMRLNKLGELGIASTSAGWPLQVSQGGTAGTSNYLIFGRYGSTTPLSGGTQSFGVYTNGNVINTNNSYGAISDIKLKENIVDANSQWDDLKDLRVVNYNFKEGQTHTQIGLVAQEVELISPGLVSESPDRDADGNDLGTVTKSVNYSVLYMKAVGALQEAMERIETLEAKVAALEAS